MVRLISISPCNGGNVIFASYTVKFIKDENSTKSAKAAILPHLPPLSFFFNGLVGYDFERECQFLGQIWIFLDTDLEND